MSQIAASLENDTRPVSLDGVRPNGSGPASGSGPPLNVVMSWVFELLTLSAGEDRGDRGRLALLRCLLASPTPEVREFARIAGRGLAEVGSLVGRLTDIGGGGLGISTVHRVAVGTITRVRLEDIDSGVCYEFPCVVVWSRHGADPRIGVCFRGRPTREYQPL